jgi:hypothetical protein
VKKFDFEKLVWVDTSANLHPYECDGPGKCEHCDHTKNKTHDPETCALCSWGVDIGLPKKGLEDESEAN